MNKPKIQVILGSIRVGRNGEAVAKWFMDAIKDFDGADVELVDLKDYPMPLLEDEMSPMERANNKNPNPAVQKWLDKISEADGYVMITAEYNHSVPGALKNAIDYGNYEWREKAIGFVGYGSFAGGARAVEHLRQIAGELYMYDVRDQIVIPMVWAAFGEDGKLLDHNDAQAETANTILASVTKLAAKLKA